MKLKTSAIRWLFAVVRNGRGAEQQRISAAEQELRKIVEYVEGLERKIDRADVALREDGDMSGPSTHDLHDEYEYGIRHGRVEVEKRYEGALILWAFRDAPEELRALSEHGGDEDWLLLIPPKHADGYFPWAEDCGWMGCAGVDEYAHPTLEGWRVRIGAHS